ncbi:MAG TPA: polysaccharide biosynthesis/export family protein [Thermoanaerobaculia bacterium]|nr:polysaccharide biosynthesis/export family protein [Thermoanaerobaculia bacterium]
MPALLLLGAPAALDAQAAVAAPAVKGPAYRLGPRDLLAIRVYELPELKDVERRVSEEGTINLPQVGDVLVAGQTEAEAQLTVKARLEKSYAQHATVEVRVKEFNFRPISVIGAVQKGGNLAFSGRWSLIEALTSAGGLAENHGNALYILRRADNGLSDQISIDLGDLLQRGDPRVNLPLLANDLINVPTATEVVVYCLGQIAHPGAVSFKSTERITLLAAVARAGGLTDRASNRIHIKRADAAPGVPEVEADYKRILAGKDPDVELHQGDVVSVKESFF